MAKEDLCKVESYYYIAMATTAPATYGLWFRARPSASVLRCQLPAQLLRFLPPLEKLHRTGNSAESCQAIGWYGRGLGKLTGA